jgi:ABC-type Fe3+-hydroxamate transport system substrate-binding protein
VALKAIVGREKDPDVDRILALRPELVVANVEENRRDVVERLRGEGVPVWVTFPRRVAEGIRTIRELGAVTGAGAAAAALAGPLEARHAEAERRVAGRRPVRVFCPIWRGPYMTVSGDTYVSDMLRLAGGANVFAAAPGRYPEVTLEAAAGAAPEVVLLPDEPFRFRRAHLQDLAPWPALRTARVHLVDGKLLSWYGPRIAEALDRLPALLAA